MEHDAIKENQFTFKMGEVCAEDFDNKSLWILKLGYDFDMSNLPQAVPLNSFIKVSNSKDLIGKAYAPIKSSKELKQLVISGEMRIVENASETDEILMTEPDNTAFELEQSTFEENDKKKHKRHRTRSSEDFIETPKKKKKKNRDP